MRTLKWLQTTYNDNYEGLNKLGITSIKAVVMQDSTMMRMEQGQS